MYAFSLKGVLDSAGFPAVVTAHFVPMEGLQRPRTTILIKFAEEVSITSLCYMLLSLSLRPILTKLWKKPFETRTCCSEMTANNQKASSIQYIKNSKLYKNDHKYFIIQM